MASQRTADRVSGTHEETRSVFRVRCDVQESIWPSNRVSAHPRNENTMSPARKVTNAEKSLRGTFRQDRAHKAVTVSGTLPRVPKWLPKPAQAEFRRVLKFLSTQGTEWVTQLDASALASYAHNWHMWTEAERHIMEHGSTVDKPIVNRSTGNVVGTVETVSPWLKVSAMRHAAMLKSIASLGFDPRSRGSVDIPPPKPTQNDSVEAYLSGDDDDDAPILTPRNWRRL
jgi:P27 family predicted phage terminase small subunit